MHIRHPAVALAFAVLFALSCGKSPDAPPRPGPALDITAGAGLTDTIGSAPLQGLVVQVLGATGRPQSGVGVVFDARTGTNLTCWGLFLWPPARDGSLDCSATTNTDAQGRAAVLVRLGTLAGPVSVRITVPLYGLTDSAAFTVLPGGPVAVRAGLPDTTVDLGSTFAGRAGVVDRAGNLRPDPVTFEATSPAVQVSGTGSIAAVAVGHAYVRVRGTVGGRTATDSTGIMVVPKARLAVSIFSGYLRLMSLAGGGARQLTVGAASDGVWSPTGDRIAYVTEFGQLAISDTLGQATTPYLRDISGVSSPEYSRDGLWIYFSARGGSPRGIYRAHPDGTGLEAVQSASANDTVFGPSPSPDGTRFAFTDGRVVLVKTLATGGVDTLRTTFSTRVSSPRWSPDGTWIAYITAPVTDTYDDRIGLVRPDGSGQRFIPLVYASALAWSPDSKWLVAGHARLTLVDVTAGTLYPLTTVGLYVAWQP